MTAARSRKACSRLVGAVALACGCAAMTAVAAQQAGDVDRGVVEAPDGLAQASQNLDPRGQTTPVAIGTGLGSNALLHVPVTGIYPGAIRPHVDIGVPDMTDEQRIWRGKQWFTQFNCVGCHGPHGGGGMGPALSNKTFLFGRKPENIYLSILQGRPMGMPTFGGLLPDDVIWDLVAYVGRLAKDDGQWGRTTSLGAFTVEQVPSHYVDTIDPWAHTEPFSFGQPPFTKVEQPTKDEPAAAESKK